MRVVFFHRKRSPGFFSIEQLFDRVRKNLPADIHSVVKEMRFSSEGFFKRLFSCWEAWFAQGNVNHITGDIHFIAFCLRKKRTVLTIHDVGLMDHPNRVARMILRLFWIQLPVWRSEIITTVSMATKLEVLKFVRVHPARIRVIYNPILPLFRPHPKMFSKAEPVILQIGTTRNKNICRLAEALKGMSCRLHIIGKVNPDLMRRLNSCGIRYSTFSNLTGAQMMEQYAACDILAFVSTVEGFGLPIVEANAVGRVVITGNVSSMPEIAGEAAHFVDPFDVASIRAGVVKVIEDDGYRDALIAKGHENRRRFDEVKIAEQYAKLYRRLAEVAHD